MLDFRKKKALKEAFLKQKLVPFQNIKIAVLGGGTTRHLIEMIELYLLKSGFKPTFYEGQFNRFYEELFFHNEELKKFNPDIIYIHSTIRNINHFHESFLQKEFHKYESMWEKIHEDFKAMIIQNNFEYPYYRILGNLEAHDPRGKIYFINQINSLFYEYVSKHNFIFINDINYLSSWLGLEAWFDQTLWYTTKYAYGFKGMSLVANSFSSIVNALYGKSKKCLVLDCDNVLWSGVMGDEGPQEIELGAHTPLGEAHQDFQTYLKELKERGIILTICSKNEPETALLGLDHPQSKLSPEDFSYIEANWLPKYQNVQTIAEKINIGIDSMVFVDDNPTERMQMQESFSLIEVPNIGNDVCQFIKIIDKSHFFETTQLTHEDIQKTRFYQDNLKRNKFQKTCGDQKTFLKSLMMKAEIHLGGENQLKRMLQLIHKTNQFNLTGLRLNEDEVRRIIHSPTHVSLYASLQDKFGDNGIVSTLIGEKIGQKLDIILFVMSCRVFQRDLELAIFDELVKMCQKEEIQKIKGIYIESPRNKIVKNFYSSLGFSEEGIFEIPKEYIKKNQVISVNNDR